LEVTYFKSTLDQRLLNSMWNTHWINVLNSSRILTNAKYLNNQITDIANKLRKTEYLNYCTSFNARDRKKAEDNFVEATEDSNKTTAEVLSGLLSLTTKEYLFTGDKSKK